MSKIDAYKKAAALAAGLKRDAAYALGPVAAGGVGRQVGGRSRCVARGLRLLRRLNQQSRGRLQAKIITYNRRNKVKTTIALLSSLMLTACAVGPDRTRGAELTWLALHAVDTAQTVTIAKSPDCLYEKNPLAVAVYGTKHPSVARVLVTNTVMAGVHYTVSGWWDRHVAAADADIENDNAALWHMGRFAWYAASFVGSGSAVVNNVRVGIKPLSTARCKK